MNEHMIFKLLPMTIPLPATKTSSFMRSDTVCARVTMKTPMSYLKPGTK